MNLRRLDLNLLVTLHAVLQHQSVTRAAGQLGMTQSGVSGELRHLRRVFGDQLLVRVGREWRLTPLAEQLTEPVSEIIRRIEETVSHHVAFDPKTSVREFSLAVSDYAMLVLIQPLARRLSAEAPGVTVHLHPLAADLTVALDVGGADLVMAPAGVVEGRPCRFLLEEHWVCAVAADHPEVGDAIGPELFESLPHLTYRWGIGRPALLAVADRELARALPDQHDGDVPAGAGARAARRQRRVPLARAHRRPARGGPALVGEFGRLVPPRVHRSLLSDA